MIITKIYKYDSSATDYLGEDFSDRLLLGYTYKNNLDDTLDTMDLTLIGLTTKTPFAPTTKFIIKIYEENNGIINQDSLQVLNMVVSDDAVEQPIMSDNNYFNHHLKLIEAGAIAQQRLVDNIAVTYKLKDVNLEVTPTYDPNEKINLSKNDAIYGGTTEEYGYHNKLFGGYYVAGHKFLWVMPNYYNVTLNGTTKLPEFTDWTDMLKNQELGQNETSKTLELPLPMLECWGWDSGNSNLRKNGLCSYNIELQKKNIITNNIIATDKYTINPIDTIPQDMLVTGFNSDYENHWITDNDVATSVMDNGRMIISRIRRPSEGSIGTESWLTRIAETGTTMNGISSETPIFSSINNRVLSLTIEKNYKYTISFTLKTYTYDSANRDTYPALYCKWVNGVNNPDIVSYTTSTFPMFNTYFDVYESINNVILFESAKPYTAYQLFNKAQIASQTILKVEGTPIEETEKTFYVDNDTKNLLQDTIIIESYYNEKNLWEIFMDIGKYIHAKPFIEFGANDKLKLSFKKYGITNVSSKSFNKASVYNSQFIQEYVSSLSSYVTNMVQLGGVINEVVAPKSSSDDYLVYNDVVEIIVSKPIIELIDLVAIRKSDWEEKSLVYDPNNLDWSGCVFEKSIYNLLGVSDNESINKGNSIYYENGTNKIQGLTYTLPSQNNDKPYAIKVILANLFNIPEIDIPDIKVNDYLFKVVYRTIDSLRTDQTRPDLRKYLKNSKFDNVPIHNQFNNQQDTIVDSQKFGVNVYGKLIRTGNEVYSVVDWIDSLTKLKKAGELYNIFDNLYYVSKNSTTYFSDHAVSEIEFTKDFNRLAQIIGIPSEPRFYEIAIKNLINREIAISDYLYLTTNKSENDTKINNFIKTSGFDYIKSLLFEQVSYNKYSITIFKNDIDKINQDNPYYDGYFQKSIIMPLNSYSIGQTLTMEWDMEDNTIAGNQVTHPSNLPNNPPTDNAYYSLSPYGYADKHNRADLIDFAILNDIDYTGLSVDEKSQKIMNYPASPIENVDINPLFGNQNYGNYGNLTSGIGLLKDNREIIKINYNIQMLSDSDRFILSNWIWQQNKTNLKLVLLNKEVNKLSALTIKLDVGDVLAELDLSYDTVSDTIEPSIDSNGINIPIEDLIIAQNSINSNNVQNLKAIAIMGKNIDSDERYFVMARNVDGLSNSVIDASIILGDNLSNIHVDKTIFESQVQGFGRYNFIYVVPQGSWTLDGVNVSLSSYGISIEGTPSNYDIISILYTAEKIQNWYIIIPPKNVFNNQ